MTTCPTRMARISPSKPQADQAAEVLDRHGGLSTGPGMKGTHLCRERSAELASVRIGSATRRFRVVLRRDPYEASPIVSTASPVCWLKAHIPL